MKRLWFRSVDGGPWEPMTAPRPVSLLDRLPEDEIYDDGYGNRYYWSANHGDPTPAEPERPRGAPAAPWLPGSETS